MKPSRPTFDRQQILALLTELGAELDRDGLRGDIYVVGGSAICLTMNTRRTTADVDAAFREQGPGIATAARVVAVRHGLDQNWINQAAASYIPDTPDTEAEVLEVPGLTIAVASPEHVMAMKLIAFRPGRDQDDLDFLFQRLDIRTPQEAVAILQRLYGDNDVVMADPIESYEYAARDVLRRRNRG